MISWSADNLKKVAAIFIGATFLFIPAFLNGYPLVNTDVNTYLCSGFLPDTPADRPITYGLLLRLFSLNGVSLFFASFLQCCFVSYLVFNVIVKLLKPNSFIFPLTLIIFLSLFSPLSWISSELIPDVFTTIALLCLLLLLHSNEKLSKHIILVIVFFISIATHFSNVIIFSALLFMTFLFRHKLFESNTQRMTERKIVTLLFITISTIGLMGSAISKSKHVFAIGALLDQGILKPYLDEHCKTEKFNLCVYKDKLPEDANFFLWDINSPLYKSGGWAGNKMDFVKINNGTFTEPKYLLLRIKMSVINTLMQFGNFGIGDGNVSIGDPLHKTIGQYIPHDLHFYSDSHQYNNTLLAKIRNVNFVFYFIVVLFLGSLIPVFVLPFTRLISKPVCIIAGLSFALIVINMFVCATLSQVIGRYGCRVIWLLPFSIILIWADIISNRNMNKSSEAISFS